MRKNFSRFTSPKTVFIGHVLLNERPKFNKQRVVKELIKKLSVTLMEDLFEQDQPIFTQTLFDVRYLGLLWVDQDTNTSKFEFTCIRHVIGHAVRNEGADLLKKLVARPIVLAVLIGRIFKLLLDAFT